MRDNEPGEPGWCARWSWYACGGNQTPPNPPAWGTPDANAVVDKCKAAGVLHTDRDAPRGAIVLWTSDTHGHMALSKGPEHNLDIMSTDPYGNWGKTGTMPQKWPEQNWGQTWAGWTTHYAGVDLPMGAAIGPGDVYVSKLVYGQNDSDSVRRLQETLNGITLSGGSTLPVTGFYGDQTAHEVGLWQTQKATDRSVTDGSHVTVAQADQMFAGTGHTVIDDVTETEPPDPSEPPETITLPLGIEYHYSGKPSGTLSFSGTYKKLDVASWAPKEKGLTFGMIYANVDGSGEFRSRLIREPHGGSEADPTAYQTHYPKGGDNYLLTHVWFESGEAGRPLHYELATMDGETMTVGTRYAKHVTIPWEVVVAVAEVGAAYMAVRRPVVAALRWIKMHTPGVHHAGSVSFPPG